MSYWTEEEITMLRDQHPHTAKTYMTIIKPDKVFSGTFGTEPSRGDNKLYLLIMDGDYQDILPGYTAVATVISTGKRLIQGSKRRVRSATWNAELGMIELLIDENSVDWLAFYEDLRIDVYRYFDLFPKFPYISNEGSTFTFYKDYDITYVDQNLNVPPVVIMGGPRVGMLQAGEVTFWVEGSASYSVLSGVLITSYRWDTIPSTGVTIVNPTLPSTDITFTLPGLYYLKLTITDSRGISDTSYRPIMVHDAEHMPNVGFEVSSMMHSWYSGGASVSLNISDNIDLDSLIEHTMIILWGEQTYNGYILNDWGEGGGKVLFAGYIMSSNVEKSNGVSSLRLECGTVDKLMDIVNMCSVSLEESSSAPTTWYQYKAPMTVDKAVHHFWYWHSTLFQMTDVYVKTYFTERRITVCDDFQEGTLYSVVDTFTRTYGVFAHVVCDTKGVLRIVTDVMTLPTETQDFEFETLIDIQPQDLRLESELSFIYNIDNDTSKVIVSGLAYDGVQNKNIPFMSAAPGENPENYGSQSTTIERQVLESQEQLNFLSGRIYAILNNPIREVRLGMAGNYPFDPTAQDIVNLNFLASDTKAGVAIQKRAVVREVQYEISAQAGTIATSIVVEPLVASTDGVTVLYPDDPTIPHPKYPPIKPIKYPNFPIPDLQPCSGLDVPANGPWSVPVFLQVLDPSLYNPYTQVDFHNYRSQFYSRGVYDGYENPTYLQLVVRMEAIFHPAVTWSGYQWVDWKCELIDTKGVSHPTIIEDLQWDEPTGVYKGRCKATDSIRVAFVKLSIMSVPYKVLTQPIDMIINSHTYDFVQSNWFVVTSPNFIFSDRGTKFAYRKGDYQALEAVYPDDYYRGIRYVDAYNHLTPVITIPGDYALYPGNTHDECDDYGHWQKVSVSDASIGLNHCVMLKAYDPEGFGVAGNYLDNYGRCRFTLREIDEHYIVQGSKPMPKVRISGSMHLYNICK